MSFQIPKRWEQWAKALWGSMISGGSTTALASLALAAEHAVGVNLGVQQFNTGQIEHQFIAGAIVGGLMYLKQSPVPPNPGDTQTFVNPNPPAKP